MNTSANFPHLCVRCHRGIVYFAQVTLHTYPRGCCFLGGHSNSTYIFVTMVLGLVWLCLAQEQETTHCISVNSSPCYIKAKNPLTCGHVTPCVLFIYNFFKTTYFFFLHLFIAHTHTHTRF